MKDAFNISDHFTAHHINDGDYNLYLKLKTPSNDTASYHIGTFYFNPVTGYYKIHSEYFTSKNFNDLARVMLNNYIKKLTLKLESDKNFINEINNINNLL